MKEAYRIYDKDGENYLFVSLSRYGMDGVINWNICNPNAVCYDKENAEMKAKALSIITGRDIVAIKVHNAESETPK